MMYKEVTLKEAKELITQEGIAFLLKGIHDKVNFSGKNKEDVGAFAASEIPLKSGELKNVWVAWLAEKQGVNVKITIPDMVIYDGLPDAILDRYNLLKKLGGKPTKY